MVKGSPVGPGLKGLEPPVELFDLLLEAVESPTMTERQRDTDTDRLGSYAPGKTCKAPAQNQVP